MSVRPSVRPSVSLSVPCYFRRWNEHILGASCAVYPALFPQKLRSERASRAKHANEWMVKANELISGLVVLHHRAYLTNLSSFRGGLIWFRWLWRLFPRCHTILPFDVWRTTIEAILEQQSYGLAINFNLTKKNCMYRIHVILSPPSAIFLKNSDGLKDWPGDKLTVRRTDQETEAPSLPEMMALLKKRSRGRK